MSAAPSLHPCGISLHFRVMQPLIASVRQLRWPFVPFAVFVLLSPLATPLGAQPGALQFKMLAFASREGGAPAVVTVTRVGGSAGTVTVEFFTEDGTAYADEDYSPASGTLTFSPGVLNQTFTVPVLNDLTYELNETVTLQLRNPAGGATIGGIQNATLNIADNDPCIYTVSPLGRTHGPEGGSGTFIVNATPGCQWTITEMADWLGVTPGSGVGSNEVLYSVDPNPSTLQRAATLRIAGRTFTVTQRGVPPPDITRPVVTIATPAAAARVTNLPLVVTGRATDARGVVLVEYRLENSAGTNDWQPAAGTTNWSASLDPLPPGANTVRLRAHDPAGNISAEVARTINYVVVSQLTLGASGNGTVTPNLNGRFLDVGRAYTVTAVPAPLNLFSNWTGDLTTNVPRLTFRMATNLQLQANFVPNPFRPVRGTYHGLFLNSGDARHESTGFFSATTTDLGAYSAKLTLAGQVLPLTGRFGLDGRATNIIARAGLNPVVLQFHLDFLDPYGLIEGTFGDGNWQAELRAHRSVLNAVTNRAPQAGRYTVLLPGDSDPARAPSGTSAGTVTIDASGRLTFTGTLADGTPVAQIVPISTDGEWPLFVRLYGGGGELIGRQGFAEAVSSDVDGTFFWNKPAVSAGSLYTNGFAHAATLTGARYRPPTNALDFRLTYTNAVVSFSDGNLETPFANALQVNPGNRFVNLGTNKLTLTLALPTGMFSGTATVPGTTRVLPFRGALHLKLDTGAGFFVGTNQGGRVLLGPANP